MTSISYSDLCLRHPTPNGIYSNGDNVSIQIVSRNKYDYDDIIDKSTIIYRRSKWQNSNILLDKLQRYHPIHVYLNSKKIGGGYYYCGIFSIVDSNDENWILKKVEQLDG